MPVSFATPDTSPLPLYVIEADALAAWLDGQDAPTRAWVEASGFAGGLGTALMLPGPDGTPVGALAGYGSSDARARHRFPLAGAIPGLAPGSYRIASGLPPECAATEALGWLLSGYSYGRYREQGGRERTLVAPEGIDPRRIEILAEAETLTRDLVNTPASDMGPEALEAEVRALAGRFSAEVAVIAGDDLLSEKTYFPMIHAVGRAAGQVPRLIDMRWGRSGPMLTLVGKGVCFDTGGLNLKPGGSMGLMKKDMGGAANTIGLAQAIMALDLRLRLRLLIPAVENSVSGHSFRPGDILQSRKGLTVEINNTDAEGRLVLADALAYGDEETPDLMISMATLTGAARVAVGPDLAPFYTDAEDFAGALAGAAPGAADPVWRLPFHAPYEAMIEPGIADLDNAPSGGFAGSITAALFLRRFTGQAARYAHFDIYSWQPKPEPGRAKGGLMQGPRAILDALPQVLNL
ncbi:leucyl aminopeptidase [Mameliella alba]|uniref:leucyl aminopeptidase family protein n=1 Tax=Mameliella alba TaxID=561184 RepID=UPI00088DB278|nr:leucyl aminopeptidase family protein [Mameliella alba]OWV47823.1 leucyl aminopeptidase [Mameliella alba]PTR39791.1 leucyl aminopeptidase [Mameliella alba]GGF61479.1 leucyl aminopeptidase [Mameliella alba]SDD12179.1 leucyl aminopeptidase [Mameliella alba]